MDTVDTNLSRIAILGVPLEIGASQRGTLMGPAALRTAGLVTVLSALGLEVTDHGDIGIVDVDALQDPPPDNARHYREIQRWVRALSRRSYQLARSGAVPIFLGGDHTLSMGSVNGVARYWREAGRELFILWLDAHADYNTPATTVSANMHGMSAAILCAEPGLDGLLGDEPRTPVNPDRLELFGIRSLDKAEKALLRDRGISIADMRAIDEFGVGVLMRRVIDTVRSRNGVLHVSFDVDFLDPGIAPLLRAFLDRVITENGLLHVSLDVDFLDPSIAPGVGTTVPGGATFREAHLVMEMLHDCGLVRSVDIVELNPFLDERGRTARVAVELIGSLFGENITDRPTPSNAIRSGR